MEIKEKPRFESCRESAVKIIKADPEITQKELYEKAKSLYGEAAAMGIRQCFSDARRELKLICKPTRGRGIISKANRRRFQAAREQLLEEKATEALINNPNITPKELHKITTTEARNSWSKRTEPTVEHEVTRETSWNLIKEIVHENDKLLAKNQTQQEAIEFLKDCLAEKNKKIERFSQEVAAMGKELTKMKTEVLRVKITGSQIYGEDSLNASK